jgi:hypothetical protein
MGSQTRSTLNLVMPRGRVECWRDDPKEAPCLYPAFPPSCPVRSCRNPVSSARRIAHNSTIQTAEIKRTRVSPSYQRMGIGRLHSGGAYRMNESASRAEVPPTQLTSKKSPPRAIDLESAIPNYCQRGMLFTSSGG